MIVVFPMLTSSTVSSNIQPGICKMLEKYIIVNNIDNLLKQIKKRADVERIGANLKLKESVVVEGYTILNEETDEEKKKREAKSSKGGKGGGSKIQINVGGKGGGGKPTTSVGDAPRMQQTLSLEPTWVKIDTPDGATVLGVKVMPFPVGSDERLIHLMMSDRQLKFAKKLYTKYMRQAVRAAMRILRTVGKIVGYKGGELTGDPKKDVLFAMSENKNNVLTLLNYADIQDEEFLRDTGGIRKLFALGWRSFVLADDVNKRAMFCLHQFKGMCSIIPYSFVYASIGREHKEVYDDLEDVRKSGGAIFRMKTNVRKAFGEAMAQTRIDSYRLLDEEEILAEEVLTEDFASLMKKLTGGPINAMMTALDRVAKTGNAKDLSKITSRIPSMSIAKINTAVAKIAPNFIKNRAIAERVIRNSAKEMSNARVNTAATLIAFGASKSGNSNKVLKDSLKNFIGMVRSKKLNEGTPMDIPYDDAADAIKSKIGDIAGDASAQPEEVKKAIEFINWVVTSIFNAIKEVKIGAKITFRKIAELITGSGTKTKIALGIGFAVLILVLIVYLTRNQ